MTTSTTDPIAAARAVLENDLSIMLLCETCPEECSCYPPADMWRRRDNGDLICEGCAETADMPVEDLHHAPRPDHVIRALLVALEAERARAGDAEAERDQALAWLAAVKCGDIDRRAANLNAEALSEIKATLDGRSEQSVQEIMDGLIRELRALPPRVKAPADAQAALDKMLAEARLEGRKIERQAQDAIFRRVNPSFGFALPEPKEASHD